MERRCTFLHQEITQNSDLCSLLPQQVLGWCSSVQAMSDVAGAGTVSGAHPTPGMYIPHPRGIQNLPCTLQPVLTQTLKRGQVQPSSYMKCQGNSRPCPSILAFLPCCWGGGMGMWVGSTMGTLTWGRCWPGGEEPAIFMFPPKCMDQS